MSLLTIKYPLDTTGTNPANLVIGEIQTMPARTIRALALNYGAFYVESLVVTDTLTNLPLTRNVQYYATELYDVPSAKYGKEVCAILIITDSTVSNSVSVNYQAIGGEYSISTTAIVQQIANLNLDHRPVAWGALLSKPEAFPPSNHLHDLGDIYGFEYVVHALERIRAAIELGDSASHDSIYAYIDAKSQQTYTEVAFTVTLALNTSIKTYMTQQYVQSVLNFVSPTSPIKNAYVYVRLIADGTNAPTFSSNFKKSSNSGTYVNINGVVNVVQFSYDGYDCWYTIHQ